MIDCHCHLADNKFKEDGQQVVERAKQEGLRKIVVVAEFPSQFDRIVQLYHEFPEIVVVSIGVHPIQKRNKSVKLKDVDVVEGFITRHQDIVRCVGEVGLDHTISQFKITEEDVKVQELVFIKQIQIAKCFSLPLNVHSRSAASATLQLLLKEQCDRVLLHAFDGTLQDIQTAVNSGFFLSIPPSFTLSQQGKLLVENVPIHLLVLESDAPALGPTRKERNEPKNCILSAKFISEVKQLSLEEVIRITTENANRLFKCQ